MVKDLIVILAIAIPAGIILWSIAIVILSFSYELIKAIRK